jgi:hypothetical protein
LSNLAAANKNRLPDYVCDAIQPVFDRLTSNELLMKCLHGGTQNPNESFHSFIWRLVPKSKWAGRKTLEHGVNLATLLFNEGEDPRCQLCHYLGYRPGLHMENFCAEEDKVRIRKSEIRTYPNFMSQRRRKTAARTAARDQQQQQEGVQYKRGDCP